MTEKDILEIKKRMAKGNIIQMELAKEYGVSQQTISKIILSESWTHVADPQPEEPSEQPQA